MIACPDCGKAMHVEETRGERRRRICSSVECGRRVTTIEVIVEDSRRFYQNIAVIPRKDLETILRVAGRAVLTQLGQDRVLALLNNEVTPEPDEIVEAEPKPTKGKPLASDRNDHDPDELTPEQLRELGIDPDSPEQLEQLGLVLKGTT